MLKVCGVTRPEDAELAVEVGALYVGIIIDAKSPRLVNPKQAKEIASILPTHVKSVGVVDARKELNVELVLASGVDVVQLHWGGPEAFESARRTLEPYGIEVAVAPQKLSTYKYEGAEYVLWDKKDLEEKFGSWGLRWAKVGVAGRITPENVEEIVSLFKPYLLDLSSGVEKKPGVKDPEKLKRVAEVIGVAL